MPDGWRIVRKKFSADAFNGKGASDYGGRWNFPGTRLVYTAEHLSLAALEMLVHLRQVDHVGFVCFRAKFGEEIIERVSRQSLGKDWRREPASPLTKDIGTTWAEDLRTAVLEVPSAVIPRERNYLINPLHRDFAKIAIDDSEVFLFDNRLNR